MGRRYAVSDDKAFSSGLSAAGGRPEFFWLLKAISIKNDIDKK
jgi:hypothetical protein